MDENKRDDTLSQHALIISFILQFVLSGGLSPLTTLLYNKNSNSAFKKGYASLSIDHIVIPNE